MNLCSNNSEFRLRARLFFIIIQFNKLNHCYNSVTILKIFSVNEVVNCIRTFVPVKSVLLFREISPHASVFLYSKNVMKWGHET